MAEPAKAAMRARVRERLGALSPAEHAEAAQRLAALVELPSPGCAVMAYLSFGDELGTGALIERAWAQGNPVAVPEVDWASRAMRPALLTPSTRIAPGARGVPELVDPAEPLSMGELALVLVPGVAFDEKGGRLGRGGGFYDRFLLGIDRDRCRVVGVCHACQMVDRVPTQPHDVRVDAVLAC